jgi:cell pole-organizing protein PopZ
MSKTARVPEPSMEEILASIRRIIADDGGAAAQARPAAPAPVNDPVPGGELVQGAIDALMASNESPAEAAVLELTQPVAPGPTPSFTAVRGPDVVFREEERRNLAPAPPPRPAPVAPPVAAAPAPAPAPVRRPADNRSAEDRLLSANSTAAVSAAFNSLAATVLSENARTLEDLVKDMMRPMLKDWLDENLPGLVERIVRSEIERVARGGR